MNINDVYMGSLVTLLHCGKSSRRSPGDRRVLMAGGFATSPAVRGAKRGLNFTRLDDGALGSLVVDRS